MNMLIDLTVIISQCIGISNHHLKYILALLLSRVQLFVTPWTVAHQAPLSMGIFQTRILEGCHALLQGLFPTQGSNPGLLYCRQILYYLSHQGSPRA